MKMHKKSDFPEQKIDHSVVYLSTNAVAIMANRSRTSVVTDITKKHLPAIWGVIFSASNSKPNRAWLIHPDDAAKYVEKTKDKKRVIWQ